MFWPPKRLTKLERQTVDDLVVRLTLRDPDTFDIACAQLSEIDPALACEAVLRVEQKHARNIRWWIKQINSKDVGTYNEARYRLIADSEYVVQQLLDRVEKERRSHRITRIIYLVLTPIIVLDGFYNYHTGHRVDVLYLLILSVSYPVQFLKSETDSEFVKQAIKVLADMNDPKTVGIILDTWGTGLFYSRYRETLDRLLPLARSEHLTLSKRQCDGLLSYSCGCKSTQQKQALLAYPRICGPSGINALTQYLESDTNIPLRYRTRLMKLQQCLFNERNKGLLLRPSCEPNNTLLRPATNSSVTNEQLLLRPSEGEE